MIKLSHLSGPLQGTSTSHGRRLVRIGRGPGCDVRYLGETGGNISLLHAAIAFEDEAYWLVDAGSAFGTTVNGERVKRLQLRSGDTIQFGGQGGPEARIELDMSQGPEPEIAIDPALPKGGHYDPQKDAAEMARVLNKGTIELSAAKLVNLAAQRVADARAAAGGVSSRQTMEIMAQTLKDVSFIVGKSARQKWVRISALAGVALLIAAVVIYVQHRKIQELLDAKGRFDERIAQIQQQIAAEQDSNRIDELGRQLEDATRNAELTLAAIGRADQAKAQEIVQSGDSLDRDIRHILAQFNASTYAVPPIFKERLQFYIDAMAKSGPTLRLVYRRKEHYWPMISKEFSALGLPEEMAYVAWQESNFDPLAKSSVGARGMWQMTAETARRLGLKVNGSVDERLDPVKQTPAAARHLANLLAEFGEDSFMLVMASYNRGEEGVRRALRQVAQEPGGFRKEKRDFWHLYTLKKLPPETREYVPKILAAAVICRHPDRYGLVSPGSNAGDSGMALR
jgi:soluble lytic murein transglycosylase-like protein